VNLGVTLKKGRALHFIPDEKSGDVVSIPNTIITQSKKSQEIDFKNSISIIILIYGTSLCKINPIEVAAPRIFSGDYSGKWD
jgi:hypothetical protein